jgi:hypothetical protein
MRHCEECGVVTRTRDNVTRISVVKMKLADSLTDQIKEGREAYLRGDVTPADEFMTELLDGLRAV